MNIEERFELVDDEYLKFDRVKNKKSSRQDLHAFILLDELFPGSNKDIIAAASHDEIYLEVDDDEMDSLSDAHIVELVRCGVRYSEESLAMFT